MQALMDFVHNPVAPIILVGVIVVLVGAILAFARSRKPKDAQLPPATPTQVPAEAAPEEPRESEAGESDQIRAGPIADEETAAEGDASVEPASASEEEPAQEVEVPESIPSRMGRLRARLARSGALGKSLLSLLSRGDLSATDWEEIEDSLLIADLGLDATEELMEALRTRVKVENTSDPQVVRALLREELLKLVGPDMDRAVNLDVREVDGVWVPATILMVGVNGTGKTTLSTDPKRLLIGDDEHGWDDSGVFNFEGGCYAKVINLDKESEPDIYRAIRRDALLENVTVDANGKIDFTDKSVTENTRVSYPIDHIEKIVKPISHGPAAENVIFLSADAFGVLPPVSILTPEQTKYYFLSGFTAKLAGTERGITEPTPTFSACFGQAFLELHPTKYAEELVKRMEQSGAKAYLVNTGWNGSGKRISIKDTRGIIDAILNGDVLKAPTKKIPFFDFEVPTELPGVDPSILDPRDTYADGEEWTKRAKDLAERFIKNFAKYEGNDAGKALVAAGPKTEA